jgi:hypothetical protein
MSATKEIEPGARAMLLLAEQIFRLDVVVSGDTLRVLVRNLSSGELEMEDGHHPEAEPHLVFSDVTRYEPGQGAVGFSLGSGDDRVGVEVQIGMLRFAERGTVRVTAQALIHQAPAT